MPWERPTGLFQVNPVVVAPVVNSWADAWKIDANLKQRFGEALSKYPTAFEAACSVFGADTNRALWASKEWLNDPIVIEAKQDVDKPEKILDKDSLCHKLLEICDERQQGYYIVDAEVKLKYLELYAKIQGYIGKVEAPTFNNFANNSLKLVFVKPDNDIQAQPVKQIEHEEIETETQFTPLKIKIVK
jgi:hypothetical protein